MYSYLLKADNSKSNTNRYRVSSRDTLG